MIDFTIPAALREIRDRVRAFVRDHVLPAEPGIGDPVTDGDLVPLREVARAAGLWNPHLPAAYGGLGLEPTGVALVQEACGVSALASLALNCMAPDEGTMHVLLDHGTDEQRERYLRPLADGAIRSCFAMTEKEVSGSDPTLLRAMARRDGDGWVLDGEKWFISGADGAAFALVMTVTDPGAEPHRRASLFLVPTDTPGWTVIRDIPTMGTHLPGGHCEIRLEGCRVPADALVGAAGDGFAIAQGRLGHGRLGHAMRWIGLAQRALDLATARARDREAFGRALAGHQGVAFGLADSAIQLHAARLMVLHAAWKLERGLEHRQEVAMVKVFVAEALGDIVDRALQVHGALGYSADTPLEAAYRDARAARIYDGPSEVHRMAIARALVKASERDGSTRAATGSVE
jgi:alkylation response protein AidB-like acyl-CoA dehydrogenase